MVARSPLKPVFSLLKSLMSMIFQARYKLACLGFGFWFIIFEVLVVFVFVVAGALALGHERVRQCSSEYCLEIFCLRTRRWPWQLEVDFKAMWLNTGSWEAPSWYIVGHVTSPTSLYLVSYHLLQLSLLIQNWSLDFVFPHSLRTNEDFSEIKEGGLSGQ